MPNEGKLRGAMAEQSFKLGLSTKALGKNNGPYEPTAYIEGMGVCGMARRWRASTPPCGRPRPSSSPRCAPWPHASHYPWPWP